MLVQLTETKWLYLLPPASLSFVFSCFQKKKTFLMGKKLAKKHRVTTGVIQKDVFLSLDGKAMTLFVNMNEMYGCSVCHLGAENIPNLFR